MAIRGGLAAGPDEEVGVMSRRMVALAATAVGIGTVLVSGTARAADGGRPFRVRLSGANEFNATGAPINPHGDADHGTMKLTMNPGQEEVCWSVGEITLTPGDSLPTAGHIHQAPAGVAGPIVVPLFGGALPAPASYPTGTHCVHAERDLIKAIFSDPSAFYVNLHDAPHGSGVMRAQLG